MMGSVGGMSDENDLGVGEQRKRNKQKNEESSGFWKSDADDDEG